MSNLLKIIGEINKNSSFRVIKNNDEFNYKSSIILREDDFTIPFSFKISDELQKWWEFVESAQLFKDTDYCQWGLELLSENDAFLITQECLIQRSEDFVITDVVIGKFIGDSDLLVVSCDEKNFGDVLVALPIDKRRDWYMVAHSFIDFIEEYIQNHGEKFWEKSD